MPKVYEQYDNCILTDDVKGHCKFVDEWIAQGGDPNWACPLEREDANVPANFGDAPCNDIHPSMRCW